MPTRRALLLGAGALALAPRPAAATAPAPAFLSAALDARDDALIAGLAATGATRWRLGLPARGHAVARRPGGDEVAAFGRRPGRFLLVAGLADGRRRWLVPCPDGSHTNGHGAYSADGGLLFVTETRIADGAGQLAVHDAAAGYRRLGTIPTGGLDPHDIRLLPDGATLVVANGGILTHPDLPQGKLNLDTMAPSLAYLGADGGRLLEQVTPPAALFRLSLRHLALGRDGTVMVAGQYEGPQGDAVPLVASHRRGAAALSFLPLDERGRARLKQYCGSAAMDAAGGIVGASSPRGGTVMFWRLGEDRPLHAAAIADVCGIAAAGGDGRFVVTSGLGGAWIIDAPAGSATPLPGIDPALRWDNHLTRI